jgi:hypothetical protein
MVAPPTRQTVFGMVVIATVSAQQVDVYLTTVDQKNLAAHSTVSFGKPV